MDAVVAAVAEAAEAAKEDIKEEAGTPDPYRKGLRVFGAPKP